MKFNVSFCSLFQYATTSILSDKSQVKKSQTKNLKNFILLLRISNILILDTEIPKIFIFESSLI